MDGALLAEDLHKTYGGTVALDGVSLSVAAGEVFGLIGPNGAGKTTLVRALTGTTHAEGRVRVLGRTPEAVDRDRVGLLPQSFAPASRLTPRELIDYYGGLYDRARDTEAVLADVGLTGAADTWYENLSGGQRRRACVGIALVNDPEVLFLDEPTTGIDPAGRRSLWDLLDSLADGGTTVFLTSHSMAEIERLADRVGLLNDGELVAVDDPDALIAEHGGESRLVVRTAAGTEAVSGTRFAVEASAEELVFHDVTPADIGDAVALLGERGVEYESLTWTRPDLEDVYLRLTGEPFDAPDHGTAGSRARGTLGDHERATAPGRAEAGAVGGEADAADGTPGTAAGRREES